MNAILVSVDFSDLLAVTLSYNRHHFDRVMVVTDKSDRATVEVAKANHAEFLCTDAFYENGADFNKWAALEEGLDNLGRKGWLCLMDADVLWPESLDTKETKEGNLWAWVDEGSESKVGTFLYEGTLYTPRRRMLEDVTTLLDKTDRENSQYQLPDEQDWGRYPLHPQDREFAGYSQIFHADDPHLGKTPWHETDWAHAGGADSFFQAKWPEANKVRPPFEVLHLGPAGVNWCGRATPYLDGTLPIGAEFRKQRVLDFRRSRVRWAADPYAGERIKRSQ
jgi:hypothetical protein